MLFIINLFKMKQEQGFGLINDSFTLFNGQRSRQQRALIKDINKRVRDESERASTNISESNEAFQSAQRKKSISDKPRKI